MNKGTSSNWWRALNACATPHFGQLVNWVLLATVLIMGCLSFETVDGVRQGPATFLAWLPSGWHARAELFWAFRVMLFGGALLWLMERGLPWSCWLTTVGAIGLWSLHMETTTNGAHIFHAASQLLIVQSLWITALAPRLKEARRTGKYWQTPLYPNWAFWLALATLGLFHTYAGVAKLTYSGPRWANGVSLQLWAYWDGRPDSWVRWLLINHRSLAWLLQWATLIFETAGILALFDRRLRLVIGLALLSFYAGVLLTFDYGFHFNFILTGLYHLPFDYWLPRWFGGRSTVPAMEPAAREAQVYATT